MNFNFCVFEVFQCIISGRMVKQRQVSDNTTHSQQTLVTSTLEDYSEAIIDKQLYPSHDNQSKTRQSVFTELNQEQFKCPIPHHCTKEHFEESTFITVYLDSRNTTNRQIVKSKAWYVPPINEASNSGTKKKSVASDEKTCLRDF